MSFRLFLNEFKPFKRNLSRTNDFNSGTLKKPRLMSEQVLKVVSLKSQKNPRQLLQLTL